MEFSAVLSILQNIFVILLIIYFFGSLFFFLFTQLFGVPFLPTSKKKMKTMLELAELKPTDTVYDLGSGEGRIVLESARHSKKSIGFEINTFLVLFSRLKAKIFRRKNAMFFNRNMWNADLSKCDVLFIYLLPSSLRRLEKKILKDMKPGSRIISNTFKFENLEITEEKNQCFLYTTK